MPFRGLLNSLLGNQDDGVQQVPQDAVRDPNRDSIAYGQQVNQLSNEQRQALQQDMAAGSQQIAQQHAMINSLYGQMRANQQGFGQGNFYHVPIIFDTSNETTLKMCEIVKKATEKLWLK